MPLIAFLRHAMDPEHSTASLLPTAEQLSGTVLLGQKLGAYVDGTRS